MTVNKLQLPAKQNAVQQKINEIIDNLGGGGATDVQINGTSITSNNVANILTESAYSASNKIATMSDLPADEIFIATYGTTTFNEVLSAYNAGKTILCKYSATNSYLHLVQFGTDSQQSIINFYFTDFIYSVETTVVCNITTGWSVATYNHPSSSVNVGNNTTPVYINNRVVTSTGLSIASSRFDGQWVLFSNLISLSTATSATTTDVTSTIKSNMGTAGTDSYKYELLIQTYCNYKSATATLNAITSNQSTIISAVSSGTTMGRFFGRITVAADKLLKFQRTAAMDTCNIYFCGYRRIGTNS